VPPGDVAQRQNPQPSPTRDKPAEQLKPPADERKRVLVELVIPCSLKILKWQVAVEKGTKAVISVNFTNFSPIDEVSDTTTDHAKTSGPLSVVTEIGTQSE
jgi:hypothetical protein